MSEDWENYHSNIPENQQQQDMRGFTFQNNDSSSLAGSTMVSSPFGSGQLNEKEEKLKRIRGMEERMKQL